MAGINRAFLIGNLGADPETRSMPSGDMVTTFNIATSERWTNKMGEKEERTEWHRIVTFGKLAEICSDYLSKGKQVYIEGRIQTRQWDDRDGNRRYTTEIIAGQMVMLGKRDPGDVTRSSFSQFKGQFPPEPVIEDDDDDDIPPF
jgi:single-strand DNA-binding protein